MHAHLDVVGGIAGDMFLGACLDAHPSWAVELEAAVRAAGLPPQWRLVVSPGLSHAMAGTRVNVVGAAAPDHADGRSDHRHGLAGDRREHRHDSGAWRDIRARLLAADLDDPVRARAVDIFERLAVVEGAAHGVAVDDVHFHELADWDSVADIVGAAWCIERLRADSWSIGALPLGGGTVRTAHGVLPVPVPAVTRLLTGYTMIDDGVAGERVTPTGAAIVAHLSPTQGPGPGGALTASGNGLGTRDLPDRANLLRLVTYASPSASSEVAASRRWSTGAVSVISFEVDDQTPEDLAVGLERVRAVPGVIDITQLPVFAKKGRLATRVQVLCRPEQRDDAIAACFAHTTTIGLRWHDESRAELARQVVDRGDLAGKQVVRPDGTVTAKPEIDSIAAVADTRGERDHAARRFHQQFEADE